MSSPKFVNVLFVFAFVALNCFQVKFGSNAQIMPQDEDRSQLPLFTFSWWDDKDTFRAGEMATIRVKVLEHADKIDKKKFKPIVTVNGKAGNSSYVSTLLSNFEGDPNNDWKISFTPIRVGLFNVLINEDLYKVYDSSLHFQVEPGNMYPSECIASWKGMKYEYEAGAKAAVMVVLKDAFGNDISKTTEVSSLPVFTLFVLHDNGLVASVPDISNMGWNEFDYVIIEFIVAKAGNFSLCIEGGNQTLNGSPLPLMVNPGAVDVSNCIAKWNIEPHAWQLASKMEIFIHQLDQYGNLVSGLYPFDAEVVERDTNLSIPIADLHFVEVDAGIQLFSFSNLEPGNFLLTIYDTKHNKSISNMPYVYNVFVGYCDGVKSVVNGSGLNDSVAGVKSEFSVYLNDIYQYPSPVEASIVQVQILRENYSYNVFPFIHPMLNKNGSITASEVRNGGLSHVEIAPSPSIDLSNNSNGIGSSAVASAFDVDYTPEKSGFYDIHVYCGNIMLNEGHSFRKEVKAAEVNTSLSTVVKFSSKVPKMSKNEIVVQLTDSFLNPVLAQQSRLKLEIASANSSGFSTWDVIDNKDGSYSCGYMAKDVGTYEICASFDGKHLLPCPFSINVYSSEYFPKGKNDTISIWEGESIAIDALANDYFAGDNASIVAFSKPDHGSLLQNGQIFRYTPYKDYYGNDSFWYTISDINGNLATAYVSISVLNVPPQFTSFPSQLQATEDLICPRFGGFAGFEITYSNPVDNISVNLSAKFGSILLSPMVMQFGQAMWSELTIIVRNETASSLRLEGSVEVINFALRSIQYLGNENFYGEDTIVVSANNKNGVNSLGVPILVDPINDPPYIRTPFFIILRSNEDETLIFDKEKDKFDFFIGDPDLPTFPGGPNNFMVSFSMEVNDGLLVTNLPVHLISTTELKHRNSYQWQSLQTYVTISEHFMVKASGIRFQGTVNDCNSVMEQLFFHGGEHGAVLILTLNDMGNHGCYPDCAEGMSMPLYTEAMVNLMRKQPMSPFLAHTLGSIIVIEFVIMFSLGVLLLYFTCKCIILLAHERRNRDKRSSEPSIAQISQGQTSSMNVPENATHFTGCCSRPSLLSIGMKSSNFRQRRTIAALCSLFINAIWRMSLKKMSSALTRYSAHSSPFPLIHSKSFHGIPDHDAAVASFIRHINKRNPPSQVEIGKILTSIVKMKRYDTAVSLFAKMEFRGITPSLITLNILLNCFCHLGQMGSAFSLLGKIVKMGHEWNVITLTTLIKGLCIGGEVREAFQFHDRLKAQGYELNEVTYGTLVKGLCRIGQTRAAIELLHKLETQPGKPNVVIYTTIIDGLCKDGLVTEAWNLFSTMVASGFSPNVVTYSSLMHGFCCVSQLDKATELLNQMVRNNINPDLYTYDILIDALCKKGKITEAQNVFQMIFQRGLKPNIVTYNTLINGYFLHSMVNEATNLFDVMVKRGLTPNCRTYSIMIDGYCKNKMVDEAMVCFKDMHHKNVVPNTITYNTLIDGLFKSGKLSCVQDLLDEMHASGQQLDIVTYNILLDGLCKSQQLEEAIKLFQKFVGKGISPDMVTYTILIDGLRKGGRLRTAQEISQHLLINGCQLNDHAYIARIRGLCKEGMIDEDMILFS